MGQIGAGVGSRPHVRLLIVDDEESIRFSLKKYFQLRSFSVDTAATATEAQVLLGGIPYDVVILDIRLAPEGGAADGLDLIERVRRASPETRIVVLSGYLSSESTERARRLQADLILSKPQPLAQLEAAIRRLL